MKKLLALVALLFSALSNCDMQPMIRHTFTAPDGTTHFGFIEVQASPLLCSSLNIRPQQGKENSAIYLRATRSTAPMLPYATWESRFDSEWKVSDRSGTLYRDSNGNIKQFTTKKDAVNDYIKNNISKMFTTDHAVKLPREGLNVRYDGFPTGYRIYVYTGNEFGDEPVEPAEYVIVEPLKTNAPCVGILAPAESYEPLYMQTDPFKRR